MVEDAALEGEEPHGGAGAEDSDAGAGDAVGEPVMASGDAEDGYTGSDGVGGEAGPVAIVDAAAFGAGKGCGGMAGGEGMVVGEVGTPTACDALEGLGDGLEDDKGGGGGHEAVGGVVAGIESGEGKGEGSGEGEELEIVGGTPLAG